MGAEAALRKVAVEADVEPQLALVADRRAVKQMVLNLLSNAVKFTPGRRPRAGAAPAASATRSRSRSRIHGIGIPKDNPAMIPGLLPPNAVKPGSNWKASAAAVGELTNLGKSRRGFDYGGACRHSEGQGQADGATEDQRHGQGVDEDGPSRQRCD